MSPARYGSALVAWLVGRSVLCLGVADLVNVSLVSLAWLPGKID